MDPTQCVETGAIIPHGNRGYNSTRNPNDVTRHKKEDGNPNDVTRHKKEDVCYNFTRNPNPTPKSRVC